MAVVGFVVVFDFPDFFQLEECVKYLNRSFDWTLVVATNCITVLGTSEENFLFWSMAFVFHQKAIFTCPRMSSGQVLVLEGIFMFLLLLGFFVLFLTGRWFALFCAAFSLIL